MKQTTQQIYNKIKQIKEKGNWIESPYRHITWIPVKEVEIILDECLRCSIFNRTKGICGEEDCINCNKKIEIIKKLKGA